MTFHSGQEMLDYLKSGKDLYNPTEELFVFLYNEAGSIAVYHIDRDEALRLSGLSMEHNGEYWGAFLGVGGKIYDDPSHELYTEKQQSNLDFCNSAFVGEWFPPDNYEKVMTDEELNTKLYQKMYAKQQNFREWMLEQPPNEILHYCYDYVIREDILISVEYNDLPRDQCKALLKSPDPLYDIYRAFEKRESTHMEDIRDTIENRAKDVIKMEKEKANRESR